MGHFGTFGCQRSMEFKVSVIIPVYNAATYVRAAVRSALAQTEVAEVIMIEDGSQDGSLAVCEALTREDKRVVLLRHQRGDNKGAAATRNLGIGKANFPFITFLDADDTYMVGRFARTKAVFAERPDCEGVYEAIGILPTTTPHNKPQLTAVQEPLSGDELFYKLSPIGNRGYFSLIGLTVRRSVFDKAGMLNEGLRVSQDTEWMIRLSAACSLSPGTIDRPVSLRRIHKSNRSTDEEFLRSQKPKMALTCLDWFVKNNMPEAKTAEVLRLYFKYRFEHVHLAGTGNRFWRKWRDLSDAIYLWSKYPGLRSSPFLVYHIRLTLRLPVNQHLDYYAGK
jgi:glycosyltransferase involved in cell wall biosynthesis